MITARYLDGYKVRETTIEDLAYRLATEKMPGPIALTIDDRNATPFEVGELYAHLNILGMRYDQIAEIASLTARTYSISTISNYVSVITSGARVREAYDDKLITFAGCVYLTRAINNAYKNRTLPLSMLDDILCIEHVIITAMMFSVARSEKDNMIREVDIDNAIDELLKPYAPVAAADAMEAA